VLTALAIPLGGCEDPLTVGDVAGEYFAWSFAVTEGGTTRDLLADGASIVVTLGADGTTAGAMVLPPSEADGEGPSSFDLEGTWTLSGDEVGFDHPADTFLRDMTFVAEGGRLTGARAFGEVTVRLSFRHR
jgi:hypothetical protein